MGIEEIGCRILDTSFKLFANNGIRSVTMDDIADALSISKKTIYTHYADKEDLVDKITNIFIDRRKQDMEQCVLSAVNPVHQILWVIKKIEHNMRSINPQMFYDLQKYYPKQWSKMSGFQREEVKAVIVKNLEDGVKEGLYRKDINVNILAHFRLMQLSSAFDSEQYPPDQFLLTDVLNELTRHFLYGIVTPKGLDVMLSYLNFIEN
jgi:AcrR family transcriptional regulator